MRRVNSMIATIMGTVINAIQLIINLFACFTIFGLLADAGNESVTAVLLVVVVSIVLLAFLLVAFILTCRIFKYMNASHEVYASKKGLIITAIVFNFLVAILLFAFGTGGSVGNILINVFCALALIATNVLYLVDLGMEDGRVKKLAVANEAKEVKPAETKAEEVKSDDQYN